MRQDDAQLRKSVGQFQELAHVDDELSIAVHQNLLELQRDVELGVDVLFESRFGHWDDLRGVVTFHRLLKIASAWFEFLSFNVYFCVLEEVINAAAVNYSNFPFLKLHVSV